MVQVGLNIFFKIGSEKILYKAEKYLSEADRYDCEFYKYEIKGSDKNRLLLGGKWRTTDEPNDIAGFWINDLYLVSFVECLREIAEREANAEES